MFFFWHGRCVRDKLLCVLCCHRHLSGHTRMYTIQKGRQREMCSALTDDLTAPVLELALQKVKVVPVGLRLLLWTDAGDFMPGVKTLETFQDGVQRFLEDGKEGVGKRTPGDEVDFPLVSVQFKMGLLTMVGQKRAFTPVELLAVAVSAHEQPAHQTCRNKTERVAHLD